MNASDASTSNASNESIGSNASNASKCSASVSRLSSYFRKLLCLKVSTLCRMWASRSFESFFRKFLSLKVAPPQSEGEQELMLPDVCSESWLTSQTKDGQLSEFISGRLSLSPCLVGCLKELLTSTLLLFIKLNAHTGLGPGQLVGRQVLGSPVLGDIQLSLCDKRGNLEVEVRPVRESQKLENSV